MDTFDHLRDALAATPEPLRWWARDHPAEALALVEEHIAPSVSLAVRGSHLEGFFESDFADRAALAYDPDDPDDAADMRLTVMLGERWDRSRRELRWPRTERALTFLYERLSVAQGTLSDSIDAASRGRDPEGRTLAVAARKAGQAFMARVAVELHAVEAENAALPRRPLAWRTSNDAPRDGSVNQRSAFAAEGGVRWTIRQDLATLRAFIVVDADGPDAGEPAVWAGYGWLAERGEQDGRGQWPVPLYYASNDAAAREAGIIPCPWAAWVGGARPWWVEQHFTGVEVRSAVVAADDSETAGRHPPSGRVWFAQEVRDGTPTRRGESGSQAEAEADAAEWRAAPGAPACGCKH